ncbi:hypothetical protein ABE82_26485 (plasmid) [Paenibacillus peoriae]|uniref:hypothetical protein n=1 Tax=Paenibacillus peoriae TaxID=59893 RepID=UPI00072026F5|nr:hypothetical protein [Paenibacillus peoriae]ALS09963.1 hypothetical protein ABE82_26485 [Paenibacillus peoriae]
MNIADLNIEKALFFGLIDFTELNINKHDKLVKRLHWHKLIDSKDFTMIAHWGVWSYVEHISKGKEKCVVPLYRLEMMMGAPEYVEKAKKLVKQLLDKNCIVLILLGYDYNQSRDE